jgi:nucleoid-associated protein YgaU
VRAVRAACLLVVIALAGGLAAWTLAPFLVPPGDLAGGGPLRTVVSTCAWLLVACLCWLLLGLVVAVADVLRDHRAPRRVLTPAFVRRLAVVCIGVSLTGSVAGVASAQPLPPSPGPAATSAQLLDGLVVPDRVEDGPAAAPAALPRHVAAHGQPPADVPASARTPEPTPEPTPESTPEPAPAPTRVPTQVQTRQPTAAPTTTPDPGARPEAAPAGTGAPARSDRATDTDRVTDSEARGTLVVRPGDSLWTIAAARLPAGAGPAAVDGAWRRLYAANRPPLGADPDLIHPGDVLRVPRQLTSEREEPR